MNRLPCRLVLAALLVTIATLAPAQSADVQRLEREIDALRAAHAGLREELRAIRAQLDKGSAGLPADGTSIMAGVRVSLMQAQFKGAADAKVVLVEFSDFQCPFCARFSRATYPQIVRDYVDAGKVRYAFMSFPIESLHPLALRRHLAAACAADQGRFWPMHDRLFADQLASDNDGLIAQASALGLDAPAFNDCLANDRHAAAIRDAMSVGARLGVTGTPTFVIGIAGDGGDVEVMRMIVGARPYPVFKEALDGVLAAVLPDSARAGAARLAIGSSR